MSGRLRWNPGTLWARLAIIRISMDLLDDPAESKGPAPAQPKAELAPPANSSSPRELSMRRLRKVFIFAGACALALVLSVRHQGQDLQIENPVPVRAAVRQTAAYDLSQLPVITKTLFYVRENYFDKSRFDHKRML